MSILLQNQFMVEEQSGFLRPLFEFDIRDPDGGQVVMECREVTVKGMTRLLRMTSYKRSTPFDVHVCLPGGEPVMRLVRGVPVVASRVRVYDDGGAYIGGFHQRAWSVSGKFDVVDAHDEPVCKLVGRSRGKAFCFLTPDGVELARVTKQWAGLAKALFSSSDHYLVEIEDIVPPDATLRCLILASAICVGLILKIELP